MGLLTRSLRRPGGNRGPDRRPAARFVLLLAVALPVLPAGCTGNGPVAAGPATPPPGCGMTSPRLLAGLVGPDARSTARGGLATLRRDGTPASCRTVARASSMSSMGGTDGTGRARSVTVRVVRHPAPLRLPSLDCDQGWVYAGTPEKYVPACQQGRGQGGRTLLLARWGAYIVRVDIARDDRAWGGDPELGLAVSKDVARRLGVAGARNASGQSASGSSS